MKPRLKEHYDTELKASLIKEFGYKNAMEAPRLEKIVVNMGVGEAVADSKKIKSAVSEMAQITGGAYFRATDTQALEEIYRRIDAMEKTEAETRRTMIPRPLFRWPLGAALLVLLLLAAISLRRGTAVLP